MTVVDTFSPLVPLTNSRSNFFKNCFESPKKYSLEKFVVQHVLMIFVITNFDVKLRFFIGKHL